MASGPLKAAEGWPPHAYPNSEAGGQGLEAVRGEGGEREDGEASPLQGLRRIALPTG